MQPPIDLRQCDELTADDPSSRAELLSIMLEDLTGIRAELDQACAKKDVTRFSSATHKVTLTLDMLAAQQLVQVIKECKTCFAKDNFPEALVQQLRTEFDRVLGTLQQEVKP